MPDIWAFQPYTSGTVFKTEKGIDEDVRWLSTKDSERLGYQTQKPEGLLERIIKASSNEGDTILDPFSGTFTTCFVAKSLSRKSIGIEIEDEYVKIGLIENIYVLEQLIELLYLLKADIILKSF